MRNLISSVEQTLNQLLKLNYKPQLFNDAIAAAIAYRLNPTDVGDQIMDELEALS